jgi:hypothetical protein
VTQRISLDVHAQRGCRAVESDELQAKKNVQCDTARCVSGGTESLTGKVMLGNAANAFSKILS